MFQRLITIGECSAEHKTCRECTKHDIEIEAARTGAATAHRAIQNNDAAVPAMATHQCLGFNLWLLRCRLEQADAFQLVGEASAVRGVKPLHGRTTRPSVTAEAAAGEHCLARR